MSSKNLSGDARATWLLARALTKETFVSGPVRPGLGLEDLESAVIVASSKEYQFWALQELMVRFGALGYADRAATALDRFQTAFTDLQQQAAMSRWRKETIYLAALYSARQSERDLEPISSYIAEIQTRLASAKKGGQPDDVDRYQKMIDNAQSRLKREKNALGPKREALKKAESELTGQP